MAFTTGLGSDTMLSGYQRDATQFKLVDIANNIQKFNSAPAPPMGQAALSSATYVDYTFHALNRFMEQDQENDNHATFLFEYQALLRSRMQQMITELTAALTRDLDRALAQTRAIWSTEDIDGDGTDDERTSAQGYSFDVEDAGAARMAYNFMTGFANSANPDNSNLIGSAYSGIPTWDPRADANINKVSPDTSADAVFASDNPDTAAVENTGTANYGGAVRSVGTAALQQGFPEDGLTEAVMDNLMITHNNYNVLYGETGGGFITAKNNYRFIDVENANRYSTTNIGYLNTSIANGNDEGNLNDSYWDSSSASQRYLSVAFNQVVTNTVPPPDGPLGPWNPNAPTVAQLNYLAKATPDYFRFNQANNVKNEFQRVLYDTIFEFDQRGLLRDIFRLSEKNGFLNDVQIASTSSISTGSQIQASIKLNFIPRSSGPVLPGTPHNSTATTITVSSGASNFQTGEIVFVTAYGPPEQQVPVEITNITGNVITFTPALPNPAVAGDPFITPGSRVVTNRQDLGGRVQIIMDRFSCFYHS